MKDRLLRGVARAALAEPLVRLVARRRQRDTDVGLDRQVAAVLELQRLLRLPALDSMEPAAARTFAEDGLSPLDVKPAPMDKIVDMTISGRAGPVPVRLYVPFDATPHMIVYFHGGGGVIGSIGSSEPVTRLIAEQTSCTVASVGYRLGPEDRHPSAIDDAVSAYNAMVERLPDGARIAVAGDSFGGYLCAHVDRAATRKPDLQVLIYPIVDQTHVSPSIERHADGYLLTKSMIHWFSNHYLNDTDDRRASSPTYWKDLTAASRAIVVTAGYDPLVDEGDAYAAALRTAGVPVRHRRYPALIHGFVSLAGAVRAARTAIDEVCGDIRELLVAR
ncbi:MAG: alpha/beta hydrolase [Myxococcota bacterium]|nr:alpha/beta hydrolase [Myxococcota bacterium]